MWLCPAKTCVYRKLCHGHIKRKVGTWAWLTLLSAASCWIQGLCINDLLSRCHKKIGPADSSFFGMTKINVINKVLAWNGTNVASSVSLTIDALSSTIKSFAPGSFISMGPCLRFLPLSQENSLTIH